MNERFAWARKAAALAPPLLVLLCAGVVSAGQTGPEPEAETKVVTESDVVAAALQNNPNLAAAMIESRRAEQHVQGEEARYSFVLRLDQQLTRSASPSLLADSVVVPINDSLILGGEIQRHLVWGTDLSLRLQGSWELQKSPGFSQQGLAEGPMNKLGPGYGTLVRLRLIQPILRGAGRNVAEAELEQARVALAAAMQARKGSANDVLRDVLTAYWELYFASKTTEIQQQSLELAKKQRDETAARVATGGLAPVEVLSFETRVATIEEDVAAAQAEERRRSIELAQAIGLAGKDDRYSASIASLPPDVPVTEGDLRALAIASSYQLLELRESVRAAEVAARTAAQPFLPRLDLDGYLQVEGLGNDEVAPAFEQLVDGSAVTAYLGLIFETPLNPAQKRVEYARARLAIRSAEERWRAAEQQVVSSLDVSGTRERAARRRLELAMQTREIASKQVEAEEARFRTGSATALQVSAAQDQLRSASLRVLRARVDIVEAHILIAHLTGQLLVEYAEAPNP